MNYGYFDNEAREYVITRPDTPSPWANYLGSPAYGAIISNNAGGYSFVQSGASGRLLRYRFDGSDRPGRYIYLRDGKTGDYWSASWQPVGKDLSAYKSECRHGLGYTRIRSEYGKIRSETLYYVPQGATFEVWQLRLENRDDCVRKLTVTGYAEFTNHSYYEQDQVNLQYSRYISRTCFLGNRLKQQIHGNLEEAVREKRRDGDDMEERFLALVGAEITSWCGDRQAFLGPYHSYGDPVGVRFGNLGNVDGYNEYNCGALSAEISLQPGETADLVFLLGRKSDEEAEQIIAGYRDHSRVKEEQRVPGHEEMLSADGQKSLKDCCEEEAAALRNWWEEKLSHFQVRTPDPDFDTMINTWNAYNCFMTFIWSRAASFTYCGLRNGYGYRDTVQDIQGIIHLAPEMAKEKIRFMLSAQVDNGGGLPLVKFTHNAGHEDTPDDASYVKETGHPAYRADDALWLFPTVYKYIAETGDTDFLREIIPYANCDEGTVYDHLKRAIAFSMNRLGPHGLPAGLHADWNDCLRLGKEGESAFVAFQYYYAMTILQRFAACMGDSVCQEFLMAEQEKLGEKLQKLCWQEDRFIRGFMEDGTVIGAPGDPEASLWLNPQSWAVISVAAKDEQAEIAMGLVEKELNTAYGAILMDPPYRAHAFDGALCVIFNAGVKENAGIFLQPQGWLILAEALRGRGNRAYQYYHESCPAAQNEMADHRVMEPYCYGQFTEGKASPHLGRSHVHWLTGTASTVMVGCVEGILGMRPDLYGLHIAPSVPKAWDGFEIWKTFRGHRLHIVVENPEHVESGCRKLLVNGEEMAGDYVPADCLKEDNELRAVMG